MSEYILTKRQKQIQVHRAIKKIIVNHFTPKVLDEIKNVVKNLDKDSEYLMEDDQTLKNYIIEEFSLNLKN